MLTMDSGAPSHFPEGFVFLDTVDPKVIQSRRYHGADNFLGRRVPGYEGPRIICTHQAALALKDVHVACQKAGYYLVVYDGYRPERAVQAFVAWGHNGQDDPGVKADYYPTLSKANLFELGYLGSPSTHSRGSTFDLTLIPIGQALKPITVSKRTLSNGEEIPFLDDGTVDMGASFDLFHEVSHHDSPLITGEETAKRELLRSLMKDHGFEDYPVEWWHYTLADEPFPKIYFDFTETSPG